MLSFIVYKIKFILKINTEANSSFLSFTLLIQISGKKQQIKVMSYELLNSVD